VSPVVADVVAYDSEMLPAVVTAMGLVAVPPIKPFNDLTGPERVVNAMILSLHASWGVLSACRQPGLSEHRKFPELKLV